MKVQKAAETIAQSQEMSANHVVLLAIFICYAIVSIIILWREWEEYGKTWDQQPLYKGGFKYSLMWFWAWPFTIAKIHWKEFRDQFEIVWEVKGDDHE